MGNWHEISNEKNINPQKKKNTIQWFSTGSEMKAMNNWSALKRISITPTACARVRACKFLAHGTWPSYSLRAYAKLSLVSLIATRALSQSHGIAGMV